MSYELKVKLITHETVKKACHCEEAQRADVAIRF